ncbi:MAG: class A beta-lactamase-related serine hydrolase [Candidatus Nanopelagicales bacterium]|jgi:beta-lactamase class A|nr:class A beta-lactamase-related serine hydrolase [Candidatus Nanopelagicales bacterium]
MWSVCALDRDGRVIEEVDADRAQSTASIGKIFLLCEVAERFVEGRLDPGATILRDPALRVADSGLWQHMAQSELSLADVALLVALEMECEQLGFGP